ncbi:uncharacterized protein LOC131034647 [Cryptomeria japonica]|uniref:uncharacterized protein LOC131034647 n=1 Tax=Cryptomeria japonica TaxID=3369 RepID=UPI0025AC1587|nr:uncharacterized protein LOC131034647 [Cryptomeria japonica]XP_057822189.1 uncharacterized protein LOC131034647 [Cryptomeria japonica]
MEGVTLSQQYNCQQQRQKYSTGRSNVDQIDSNSQLQQEQEDLAEDINDIELGQAFDINTLERRLSDCFGHMRNHFEGEYFCKKGGPKFGYYGSFLPIREQEQEDLAEDINDIELGQAFDLNTLECRLNDCFGHMRNHFEREYFFGNGGPKFGFYGSFLPIREHNPQTPQELNTGQMVTTGVDTPSDMTPLSLIRIMTSYEVPGGSLISPLPKVLMEGQGKEDLSSKVIKRTSGKL